MVLVDMFAIGAIVRAIPTTGIKGKAFVLLNRAFSVLMALSF